MKRQSGEKRRKSEESWRRQGSAWLNACSFGFSFFYAFPNESASSLVLYNSKGIGFSFTTGQLKHK